MILRTDEPMEGIVFYVQDHTRQKGTSGPVHMGIWLTRTSMGLKSPSDGCCDGRDRTTLWWAFAWEERRTFHPGHFGRARPRGNHPLQMRHFPIDGKDVTEESRHYSEHVVVWWGCLARVVAWRSPRRANVLPLDAGYDQKGPTSPSRGLDVPSFAHIMSFFWKLM